MYLQDYIWFMAAFIICMVFSAITSAKVRSSFAKNDKIKCFSGMTGYDAVMRLMTANGVNDISVGCVKGDLTDHYNPKKNIINLSEKTYGQSSVAAVAVAAHEMGHVMQNKDGYIMYKLRSSLVPIVNFASRLSFPLVLIGLFIDYFSAASSPDRGFYIAMVGVILYGSALLFAFVTLPVELDASRRAINMMLSEGVLTDSEIPAAKQVLSAAALTYLASLLTSIVYFLRFLVQVLTLFGKRDD